MRTLLFVHRARVIRHQHPQLELVPTQATEADETGENLSSLARSMAMEANIDSRTTTTADRYGGPKT